MEVGLRLFVAADVLEKSCFGRKSRRRLGMNELASAWSPLGLGGTRTCLYSHISLTVILRCIFSFVGSLPHDNAVPRMASERLAERNGSASRPC